MNIPLALRHKSVRLSPQEAARRVSDPFSRHGTAGHPVSSGMRFRQVSSDARHRDARARRAGDRRGSGKRDPFVRKPRFEIVARLNAIHGRAPVDVGRARIIVIACAAAVLHPVRIFRLGIPACSARPRRAPTGHLTGSACDWKRSARSRRIREGFAPRSSNWAPRRPSASPRIRCVRRCAVPMAPDPERSSTSRPRAAERRHARIRIGPGVPWPHSAAST